MASEIRCPPCDLFNTIRNTQPVQRAGGQRLEHQKVEGPL